MSTGYKSGLFDSFCIDNTTIVKKEDSSTKIAVTTTTHTTETLDPNNPDAKPKGTTEAWEEVHYPFLSDEETDSCVAKLVQYRVRTRKTPDVLGRDVMRIPKEKIKSGDVEINRGLLVMMGLMKVCEASGVRNAYIDSRGSVANTSSTFWAGMRTQPTYTSQSRIVSSILSICSPRRTRTQMRSGEQ